MHGPDVQGNHLREQRRRRRSAADRRSQPALQLVRRRMRDDAEMHGRRGVVVGDPLAVDQLPDGTGIDLAQADMPAADRGHRPGEAPAVAMEHRHHPELHRIRPHLRLQRLHQRIQVGAAVGVHHTLRTTRRPRGVVDRYRRLLVAQRTLEEPRRAAREKRLVRVVDGAGVVDPDRRNRRAGDERLELVVDEQQLRA